MEYEEAKKVKGRAIKGYLNFIKKKWGADGLNSCQKSINLDFSTIQDEKWYLNDRVEEVLAWIAKEHGIDYVRQAGMSLVANTGIVSFAARIKGIEWVLDRATRETRESLNFGSVTVDKGDKTATVHLKGMSFRPETCIVWGGILEGLYDLTKTKGTVTKVGCEHTGAEACSYEMVWGK